MIQDTNALTKYRHRNNDKIPEREAMVTAKFCYDMLSLFMQEIEMLRNEIKKYQSPNKTI